MTPYTLLNQIFYNTNKFDVNPQCLEKYMLFQSYVQQTKPILLNISNEKVEEFVQKIEVPKIPKLFESKKIDQLFWNMFVLEYGEAEYFLIDNKHKNLEIEEKKEIMDYVTKQKGHVKSQAQMNGCKITSVKLKSIESELLIDKKTSWYGLWVMCSYYKKNVLIVQNQIFMEFNVDNAYDTYLFERNDDGHVKVDCEKLTSDKIQELKYNKLKIDPFQERILKGVSSYKNPELEHMAQILHVFPEESKPKKNDYYQAIINKLVSMKIQN